MIDVYQILGAIGLILVSYGVIVTNRRKQDILFIIGGIFLTAYSISIGSTIFIILQIVFIIAAIYSLRHIKHKIKRRKK